ncbi:hypothetical protein [Bradyrhizobium sp. Cp5.3]|uniref:hypothetical protein n=1 Tax=Bradyrhizobium sp. Cp5.3 TaxID=443598 RepID=UPI0012EBD0D1|nr:hypothetical protein [Bradyrhizobium sp. Cp5.3]
MSYYVRASDAMPLQVWRIDDVSATCLGVTNPETGAGTYFKAEPGEPILDAVKRQATSWFAADGQSPFHKSPLKPGEFFPRMARPTNEWSSAPIGFNPGVEGDLAFIATARGQTKALTRQLDRICQTVHPSEGTLKTYGHDIRNLLILACTEVEMHWRGVLSANGYLRDRYDTRDYVNLRSAMKLDQYEVSFSNFPWLSPVGPFGGWGYNGRPSQDLEWYDAYNAVKHDRENSFERATLAHCFAAVSACFVMMTAQFGSAAGFDGGIETGAFFEIVAVPAWALSEIYLAVGDEHHKSWCPINFDFSAGKITGG